MLTAEKRAGAPGDRRIERDLARILHGAGERNLAPAQPRTTHVDGENRIGLTARFDEAGVRLQTQRVLAFARQRIGDAARAVAAGGG